MAYYDALIAAWNGVNPPAGVTGQPLTGTTDQKLTKINAWTVVGPAIPMIVPTYQIYNLMVTAEFNALTAPNQQFMRDILSMGFADLSQGTQARARMVNVFPNGTQTFTNMNSLATKYDSPQIPWATANGYPHPITGQDLVNAGLS